MFNMAAAQFSQCDCDRSSRKSCAVNPKANTLKYNLQTIKIHLVCLYDTEKLQNEKCILNCNWLFYFREENELINAPSDST